MTQIKAQIKDMSHDTFKTRNPLPTCQRKGQISQHSACTDVIEMLGIKIIFTVIKYKCS